MSALVGQLPAGVRRLDQFTADIDAISATADDQVYSLVVEGADQPHKTVTGQPLAAPTGTLPWTTGACGGRSQPCSS